MTSMRVTIGDKLSPGIYFWEDLLFWPNMSISSLDMCTSYPLCDIKFSPGKWGGQCVFAVFHLFCPHFFFFFFFKVELEITILTGGFPKCSLLQVIVFKVQSCLPYPFPNIPLSLSSFHQFIPTLLKSIFSIIFTKSSYMTNFSTFEANPVVSFSIFHHVEIILFIYICNFHDI